MKILIGDKEHVDFDEPIAMPKDKQKEFIELMRSLYAVVDIEQGDEIRTQRLGDKFFFINWEPSELEVLLEMEDTEKMVEMLGRTWMSVDIKRGKFLPGFIKWADKTGYDLVRDDVKELIKKYMKEKEIKKKQRRQARQQRKQRLKKCKQEIESQKQLIDTIKLRKNVGRKIDGDEERIKQAKEKIKELKRELQELEKND